MNGFTLLEILLAVAALSLIAGIGAPFYTSFQTRNDLDIAATTFANGARRAITLARAADGDSGWGIVVATSSMTVFKGATYAARDTTVDEDYPISGSIMRSGTLEYDFAKFTGYPTSAGTTTLTSANNETRVITINAKGTANY